MDKEIWCEMHNATAQHYLGNLPLLQGHQREDGTYQDRWEFARGYIETYGDPPIIDVAEVSINDNYTLFLCRDRVELLGNFVTQVKVYCNQEPMKVSNKQVEMTAEEATEVVKHLIKQPGKAYQLIYRRAMELIGEKE